MSPDTPTPAEPLAWLFQHDETGRMVFCPNDGVNTVASFVKANPRLIYVAALGPVATVKESLKAPPAAEIAQPATPEPTPARPEDEAVYSAIAHGYFRDAATQPATHVALTDEQIEDIWAGCSDPDQPDMSIHEFARAVIRAALAEDKKG